MRTFLHATSFFGRCPEHQKNAPRRELRSEEQLAELASQAQVIVEATQGSYPDWLSALDALSILVPLGSCLPRAIVDRLSSPELAGRIQRMSFTSRHEIFGNYKSLFERCLDCGDSSLASAIIKPQAEALTPKIILKTLRDSKSNDVAAERFAIALEAGIINGSILSALALHSNSWGLGFAEIAGIERERRALGRILATPETPPSAKRPRL